VVGEVPGRHETIAAIVARPTKHCNRAHIGKATSNLLGHGAAGILHQDHGRHPALDSNAVRFTHFLRRQKFDLRTPCAFLVHLLIS
jgi:hypothetical protein